MEKEEDVKTAKITTTIDNVANAIRESSKVLSLFRLYNIIYTHVCIYHTFDYCINFFYHVFERSHPPVYLAKEIFGYLAKEIFDELHIIGVEPEKISCVYLFLVDKPEKVHALFGCPLPMRMSILRYMMGVDY